MNWETIYCHLEVTPENYPSFASAGDSVDLDLDAAEFYMDLYGEDSFMRGKITAVETHTNPEDGELSFRCNLVINEVELRGVGSGRGSDQLWEALRHTTGFLQALSVAESGESIRLYNCRDGQCSVKHIGIAEVGRTLFMESEFKLYIGLTEQLGQSMGMS